MVFQKEQNQSISVTLSNTDLTFGQCSLCEGVVAGVAKDMIVDRCVEPKFEFDGMRMVLQTEPTPVVSYAWYENLAL